MVRPANAVTKILKDLYKKRNNDGSQSVVDLPEDVKGTSIRSGGAIVISNHPSCDIYHAICRGDWDLSGACNVFEYVLPPLFETMTVSCAALCGWKNARVKCYPPRCVFMDSMNAVDQDKVRRFANYIFENQHGSRLDHLQTFKLTMLAALLQYLDRFIEKYGVDHIVVKEMHSKATSHAFNIDLSTLLEWGNAVDTDWKLRNVLAVSSSSFMAIDSLTNVLSAQRSSSAEQIKSLTHETHIMKAEVKRVNDALTTQSDLYLQLSQHLQSVERKTDELLRLMRSKALESVSSTHTPSSKEGWSHERKRQIDYEDHHEIIVEASNSGNPCEMNKEPPAKKVSVRFTRTDTHNYSASAAFEDYYSYELDNNSSWIDGKKSQKHVKSMITRVVKFFVDCATPNMMEILLSNPRGEQGSSQWLVWNREKISTFKSLEVIVHERLCKEESAKGMKSPKGYSNSVSTLERRLQQIKWSPQVTLEYSAQAQTSFKSFFGK